MNLSIGQKQQYRHVVWTYAAIAGLMTGCSQTPDSTAQHNDGKSVAESATAHDLIDALEKDTTRLEDIEAIKRLQRAYGYYTDAADWPAVANLFSDTASLEIGASGVYIGHDNILRYLRAQNGGGDGLRQGQLNETMQLQPVIHVGHDGVTAKGRWRTFSMKGQFGESALWAEGPQENEYIKENGVWKISKLQAYETFAAPYKGGWAKHRSDDFVARPLQDLAPDKPSTNMNEPWPAADLVPFHCDGASLAPAACSAPSMTFDDAAVSDMPGNELKTLASRIQARCDVAEIENLISAYGYYLDKNLWTDAIALITDDGVVELGQRGVYRGKESIERLFSSFGPEGPANNRLNNQMQAQPVIHVAADGKRAWARSRAIGQAGEFGEWGEWSDGVYENEFERIDGVWKITSVRYFPTFVSDYDGGFMNGAQKLEGPSTETPPDSPPSAVYGAFPDVYLLPFHYPHPVTQKPIKDFTPDWTPARPAPIKRSGPLAKDIKALDKRIIRLEDIHEVENLQKIYGFFVDKAMWREVADLFSEDGTLEIGGRGVFSGTERIYEYMQFLGPEGVLRGRLVNHMQIAPVVTISPEGEAAKLRGRFLAQGGDLRDSELVAVDSGGVPTGNNTYLGTGFYENAFIKEDGVWKIKRLYAFFRMYTLYQYGWGEKVLPLTTLERDLPPDGPATMQYTIYPDTFIPAPQFTHPVTGAPADPLTSN